MKSLILKNSDSFHVYLIESLRNPKKASIYLQVALEEYEQDQDAEAFLLALRNVAEAHGGLAALAKKIDMNRQHLYRALSSKGNPTLLTLDAILHGLGFRLSIEPLNKKTKQRRSTRR